MRALKLSTAILCLLVLSSPADAATILFRTDAELIQMSERVVHGRVVGQRNVWGGPDGQTIYTVTTIAVIEDFTGASDQTIEVVELGGVIGQQFLYVGGAVQYQPAQEVLVMLERGPHGLRSVAMNFSKFEVLRGSVDDGLLRRNMEDTQVVGGGPSQVERSLGDFRRLAREVLGRNSRRFAQSAAIEPVAGAEAGFTTLQFNCPSGPIAPRWLQADSGIPVTWFKNTSAPPPLFTGDGVTEINLALAAWTNPASASITLQYAGTTAATDTTVPDGSGVIMFEDPYNNISGSTLAVGGGSGFCSGGGTVNGTTFARFTKGYIRFQNAADLSPNYRESRDFARVLEHEVGHTIGLGHSDSTSAIMYFACCSATTPTAPNLGADDLAGLNFIYPSSAPSCTFSINPTSASVGAGSATGTVSVTTQAGCQWSVTSNSSFLSVTSNLFGSGSGTVSYAIAVNSGGQRTGTLSIAGHVFTVTQAAACSFSISPTSVTVSPAGGTGTVTVTATAGCPSWTAASNSGFITLTSGAGGTGSGTVGYSVAANGVSFRRGTMTIAGRTFTVDQLGTGPTLALDRTSLIFGATTSGFSMVTSTQPQTVRLTQPSGSPVAWTAASNRSWLQVSPSSGTGSATLTISVSTGSGLPAGGAQNGAIELTFSGAGNSPGPVVVTLNLYPNGFSGIPFGAIDTPLNNATGITGTVPFTGWALDDVQVSGVAICRAAVAGETAPPDGRCGGAAQIYVGNGVFIDGARPDVQAAAPNFPLNSRAGWGFAVLTNMLPNQGNGTYTFSFYLTDRDAHTALLGARTITCANAGSLTPFGSIDTPGQGETASGSSYVNFGWALTPMPKTIPVDGSTIIVFVDGAPVGPVSYNHFRSDIATLFPGLNNSNGAIGFRVLDTTALADGLHTIAWSVTDDAGVTTGIGSRFFSVDNSSAPVTASGASGFSRTDSVASGVVASGFGPASTSPVAGSPLSLRDEIDAAPLEHASLLGRRGWNAEASFRRYGAASSGIVTIRGEELDRFEVRLKPDAIGYLRVGRELASLPIGSHLTDEGVFTWHPGVGFVGQYDMVFVRWAAGRAVSRQEVRFLLHPKGSGRVGPQLVIDTPRAFDVVGHSFFVGGWAVDLDSAAGTGIDTLHAWAYPVTGEKPIFVGTAFTGGERPDVSAVHGAQFRESGFGLIVQGLPAGLYDLAVFPYSNVLSGFAPASVVRIHVR